MVDVAYERTRAAARRGALGYVYVYMGTTRGSCFFYVCSTLSGRVDVKTERKKSVGGHTRTLSYKKAEKGKNRAERAWGGYAIRIKVLLFILLL